MIDQYYFKCLQYSFLKINVRFNKVFLYFKIYTINHNILLKIATKNPSTLSLNGSVRMSLDAFFVILSKPR
jgi:hypothetical protein